MAYLPALQSSLSLISASSSQLTLATVSTELCDTATLCGEESSRELPSHNTAGINAVGEHSHLAEDPSAIGSSYSQVTLVNPTVITYPEDEKWFCRLFRKIDTRQQQAFRGPWQPSWVRAGPLLGLTALIFILLSTAAHAIILGVSDGQAVKRWEIQPSVYISVLTGIGNKALGFAALQGAIITWWIRALKGITLAQLHYDWPLGVNIFSWTKRHLSLLPVTSICAIVITIDGVLLQSATITTARPLNQPVRLAIKLAPEIPTNYTATGLLLNANDTYLHAVISSSMAPTWHDWINRLPIPSPVRGCDGTCAATVKAAAVDLIGCASGPDQLMNYTSIRINDTSFPFSCQATGYKVRCALLEVQVQPSAASEAYEAIDVSIGRYEVPSDQQSQDCAGHYTWKTCSFRSAIAEYDITTYNNTFVTISHPRILMPANNSGVVTNVGENVALTIGGIGILAAMKLYTSVGMWNPGSDFPYTDNLNTWQASLMENADAFHSRVDCVPRWKDPLDDITTTLNELMLRTSVQAARDVSNEGLSGRLDQELQVEVQTNGLRVDAQPVFRTRWPFFWAAASVQVVCVLLVLITYRDYWLLGRTMSLSPLEIARAFDAPVMMTALLNATGCDFDKLSATRIKYSAGTHRDEHHEGLRYSFKVDLGSLPHDGKQTLPLGA